MAIGLALLLGFQFPRNFNRPYAAVTLQEFWRRWHMSLSRWLRDYLYIGLGGNRKGRRRTYINLMLTMILGGLWHGAAGHFVLWGGMHGTGLAAERWYEERRGDKGLRRPIVRWFLTFSFVCLAWVFVRAGDLGTVAALLSQILTDAGSTTVTLTTLLTIAVGLSLQFLPRRPGVWLREGFARLRPVYQGTALASVLLVTSVLLTGQGVAPFIYYRF
jgi:D-alanyl-lipoteichoic acid acyltransferase DltB (MBOAT superfamily)